MEGGIKEENKMKLIIRSLCIMGCLVAGLTFLSCRYNPFISPANDSPGQESLGSSNWLNETEYSTTPKTQRSDISAESEISPNSEQTTESLAAHETYDILGDSDRLSDTAKNRLIRWRKDAVLKSHIIPEIITNGPTDKLRVALTFDDGPDGVVTPLILDILDEYNVKAGFFFIGNNVKRYPDVVLRTYEAGHLVLAHSYEHSNYNNLTYEQIMEDFRKVNHEIELITGSAPSMMRPPYGIINDNVIRAARNMDQLIILWSTDTMDWSQKEKANIVQNVLDNVRPGEIVLLHSAGGNVETAKALPEIITGLRQMKYELTSLDRLLDK